MKGSIISGSIHGFLAVALGAFGAHALKAVLDDYGVGIWDTAVQYQMFHATAILIIGVLMSTRLMGNVATLKWAAILMNLGIIIFAGSLYVLAISGIKILGAITPIGGVLFLTAWILVIVSVLKHAK
ncbi:DUF423 domain-containing protein [Ureibacillus manganicus]|uniref:Membrane protein n=1 Tax=Ureibacillus manganicus DSM 26584 TaxID=1384049 RepID=A0A0A3I666_9BACL|nr:DUF423 domain-containing protein [Ureibacillus manganicus]KGR80214.1 membrane protein [Ureibacillus manganicus DSM 26584]